MKHAPTGRPSQARNVARTDLDLILFNRRRSARVVIAVPRERAGPRDKPWARSIGADVSVCIGEGRHTCLTTSGIRPYCGIFCNHEWRFLKPSNFYAIFCRTGSSEGSSPVDRRASGGVCLEPVDRVPEVNGMSDEYPDHQDSPPGRRSYATRPLCRERRAHHVNLTGPFSRSFGTLLRCCRTRKRSRKSRSSMTGSALPGRSRQNGGASIYRR